MKTETKYRLWYLVRLVIGIPVCLRIQENFVCVGIDRQTIERIEVWRAQ